MSKRAVQLDGLRAIAMMAIAWDHWCPRGWPRVFPFEICLYLFLVLTGYLITGSLLRERDRAEERGGPWRMQSLKTYQIRRGLRILAPYYASLAFALLVGASDMWRSLGWYVFHVANIHIAKIGFWPPGTSHYWSLSMQQQFYLIWPFIIWFLPKRTLPFAIFAFAAIAPISRLFVAEIGTWVAWPDKLTWNAFDYFGIGGLMAWAIHRGMSLESPGLRWISVASWMVFIWLFVGYEHHWPSFGLGFLQQSFLSVGLCGLIAATSVGFKGPIQILLENPILQRIGTLSYGVYLFHNLAPLAAGKIMPFLWNGHFDTGFTALIRIAVFSAITWIMTLASWRWIELPLQSVRNRFNPLDAKQIRKS
ncbi:acyltransferase [Luteolibacter pohnpeiensis]|uniref:Acyltransferase n=1 Tax=Luteolibacter pohnpeiensis TaxID=454153 RepID=A0A934S418_9BACT|nr:acyltransferase [Luteolibacter pohnpeiensis]MBK1880800.1 acyltransferase [Luteolibacter pohnpeiensis]